MKACVTTTNCVEFESDARVDNTRVTTNCVELKPTHELRTRVTEITLCT